MAFGLLNGGPPILVWGYLFAYSGVMAQAASLSEQASRLPIAGALYHWTYATAPRSVTWLQGWLTWFGWVTILSVIVNLTVIAVQAMVSLQHPNYVAERWHTSIIAIAIYVILGLVNSFKWTFKFGTWLNLVAGVLHVALFVLIIVVLWVMGSRNSPEDIFVHQEIWSGWDNVSKFISWNIGLLSAVTTYIGFDNAAHMSEEVENAKTAVARAIFWPVAINGMLAFVMVISLLSAMGSIDEEIVYNYFPLTVVLMRTTNSTAASTALISGVTVILIFSSLGCAASASRLTWALSRDGFLHKWFAVVNPKHHLPRRAVWLVATINILLSLLNIGSSTAYGAFLSLTTISLFSSYGIAIIYMLVERWRAHKLGKKLELGKWNMSGYGVYVNAYALLYTVWVVLFLPYPIYIPVTAVTMNYSGPIILAFLIFVLGSWFIYFKKKWPGINEDIVDRVKKDS